ncbi:DNA repair protein RAD51 homolog 3 isoform X2 [Drosophila takahashii]|uniref:DNA repair protein RAD51 homolog 3 isoform X2 n=1 Tax=Drosophila takahashii TaxID=29030 RepID=UPI0038996CC6
MEKGASVFSKTPNLFNKSCWDISQRAPNKILTGNRALDKHFGGGIALGQIIELIGNSGTGKTQMCLQLCLNVQIPKTAGGLEGSALFIDSRQDFHPDRLLGLALDLAKQYKHKVPEFKALEMLKKIHHVRCPNLVQLMATVLSCHRHIADHPDVILIVFNIYLPIMTLLEFYNSRLN